MLTFLHGALRGANLYLSRDAETRVHAFMSLTRTPVCSGFLVSVELAIEQSDDRCICYYSVVKF